MELCNSLRMLFRLSDGNRIPIVEIHSLVNKTIDKEYSVAKIIIGMDYAGFIQDNDDYLIELVI